MGKNMFPPDPTLKQGFYPIEIYMEGIMIRSLSRKL
jgi:hypothetical protein